MSDIEKIMNLLDKIPEYKIGYVLGYIQGIVADEEFDDNFCEKLIEEYQSDPDDEEYLLENCKKEWGI